MGRINQVAWRRAAHPVGLGVFSASQPVTVHDLRHREAIQGKLLQEAFNHFLTRCRDGVGNGVGALQDACLQQVCAGSSKWHCGSHHEVKQDTQCPQIHVLAHVTLLLEQLRRCVRQRATECMKEINWAAECAETKVAHFNAVSAGVEDVLRLQVPVHNIIIMLQKGEEKRL